MSTVAVNDNEYNIDNDGNTLHPTLKTSLDFAITKVRFVVMNTWRFQYL